MCVCYTRMHIHTYICKHVYIYLYTHTCVCMCVCVCVYEDLLMSMKRIFMGIKGEDDNNTVTIGGFNTPLTSMDRSSR